MTHFYNPIIRIGKPIAAITYIIYIILYLAQTTRMMPECPKPNFNEPRLNASYFLYWKKGYMVVLNDEHNIVSTHQVFRPYMPDILEFIRGPGSALIAEDRIFSLEKYYCNKGDLLIHWLDTINRGCRKVA